MARSDESDFLLHHVNGGVHERRLAGEGIVPRCTIGIMQAGRGSMILWVMLYWGTMDPAIHEVVTFTRTTFLNVVTDQVNPFMETKFHDGSCLFQECNLQNRRVLVAQQ